MALLHVPHVLTQFMMTHPIPLVDAAVHAYDTAFRLLYRHDAEFIEPLFQSIARILQKQ
jgi:hypothetical protein